MKRTLSVKMAVAASVTVLAALSPVQAQNEDAAKPAEEAAVAEPADQASAGRAFYPLMRCMRVEAGVVQVKVPRAEEWVAAEEGRLYPFGSTLRAADGVQAVFALGEKAEIVIDRATEFATREIAVGETARALDLIGGRVTLRLPPTLRNGLIKVVAPAFVCENLAGESTFDYTRTNDGDEAVVRCVTGVVAVRGDHYAIPRMDAANQIRIRTTGDKLFTSLRGESGMCKVLLDQGMGVEKNFETGEVKTVPRTLEFAMSPKCAIKIFRAKSAIGGNMCVSMMTFGASGQMLNRIAFAEGRANVNSGELVIAPKVPEDEKKKAEEEADDAEEVEAAEKSDDAKADEGTDEGTSEI